MLRNRTILILTLCALLLLPTAVSAQKPGAYGFWPGYFGSAAINDRWGIWGEAQYRAYDFTGDLEQLLLRTALTYNLSADKNQQLAAGYAFVRSEPYINEKKGETAEHRHYQQLILKQRFGRFYLQHRYRLEERFLEEDFRVRFRYFLGGNFCLNKPELGAGTLYLTAYNEVFLHADNPVFDRNRLYGGVGYGISGNLRLEAGQMWQMQATATRPQLQLMLFHNFSL